MIDSSRRQDLPTPLIILGIVADLLGIAIAAASRNVLLLALLTLVIPIAIVCWLVVHHRLARPALVLVAVALASTAISGVLFGAHLSARGDSVRGGNSASGPTEVESNSSAPSSSPPDLAGSTTSSIQTGVRDPAKVTPLADFRVVDRGAQPWEVRDVVVNNTKFSGALSVESGCGRDTWVLYQLNRVHGRFRADVGLTDASTEVVQVVFSDDEGQEISSTEVRPGQLVPLDVNVDGLFRLHIEVGNFDSCADGNAFALINPRIEE